MNCNCSIHSIMRWTLVIISSSSCRCPTNITICSSIITYATYLIICSATLNCLDIKWMTSSIYTKANCLSYTNCYWRVITVNLSISVSSYKGIIAIRACSYRNWVSRWWCIRGVIRGVIKGIIRGIIRGVIRGVIIWTTR